MKIITNVNTALIIQPGVIKHSLLKTGLFINNNPVIDMDLRVQDLNNGKTWLVEKHQETARFR
jgi:hypothetical protein